MTFGSSIRFLTLVLLMMFGAVAATAQTLAYVANALNNSVSVIDTTTNPVIATIPVGVEPAGVTATPNGQFVYVANNGNATISVISVATNSVVATIPAGTDPSIIAFTPNGAFAYVTNYLSNTVSVIDTATNTVVAIIPVGAFPQGIAIVVRSQGPTSAEQCKKGGWRNFTNPTFRNQGECVSYAHRRS